MRSPVRDLKAQGRLSRKSGTKCEDFVKCRGDRRNNIHENLIPMSNPPRPPDETGVALLIALIALSLFSILGLYMTLNATTGLQISDNHESYIQATYAAHSGLNHARVLLRGLAFNDLLKGPDGAYDENPSYLEEARSFKFRNPVPLAMARSWIFPIRPAAFPDSLTRALSARDFVAEPQARC
jgi:hypothetical protein